MIIAGGFLALPGVDTPVRADITISEGIISAISVPDRSVGVSADPHGGHETINADGMLVLPGGVDPHVHFDDPGYTDREDFLHGTSAAASGGITTVIDMPCTSIPPVTSAANLQTKLEVVSKEAVIDFGFYGGVSGQVFEAGARRSMEELAPDVLGFKTYFISGMQTFNRVTHTQFSRVLEIAAGLHRPVLLHAEDFDSIAGSAKAGRSGGNRPIDYYHSRPEDTEILAVRNAAELAAAAWGGGAPPVSPPLHIVHVSTGRAAQIIGSSPFVTGETGPQYLAFTLEDFEDIGSPLKVTPPPRPAPNNEQLWSALANGTLGFVASDHAPAPAAQKHTGSIWTDYGGIPGTGTLLPYLFSEGYSADRFGLSRLVELTSSAAARRYGLDHRKGSLQVGMDGDCVLIDPDAEWTVKGSEFLSKGTITPFDGMTLTGKVTRTIVRGRVVYDAEHGITTDAGSGVFLRRGPR
ncbi:MAG: amidohydrolase family protein [Spirochaetales bacterium]|nr:amidohydrolase family protein [Spirochaetales bacterium]